MSGAKEYVNNSFSRGLVSQLPGGRALEKGGCPRLEDTRNSTLYLIIPGWEGIITNFILNVVLTLICIIGFAFLIQAVKRMERKRKLVSKKRPYMTNWLQFVYGKRTANETILYTTKQINRDHPEAYLPVVLHRFSHMIKDRVGNLDNRDVAFYRTMSTVFENRLSAATSPGGQTINSPRSEIDPEEEPEPDPDDQREAELKSVLWDYDATIKSSHSSEQTVDANEKEVHFKCGFKPILNWFSSVFLIKDEAIFEKKGLDAIHYLIFQRYVIYLLFCTTVICLLIILPINVYGGRLEGNQHFMKTTILNIQSDSKMIYIHFIMTIVIVVMGIFLMQNFSIQFIDRRDIAVDKQILFIESIPKGKRNAKELKEFIETKFSGVQIKRITFTYDVNYLIGLMMQLWTAIEAKKYCKDYEKRYGQKCEVRPYILGHFLGFCCLCRFFPKLDGLSYYRQEKVDLEKKIVEEARRVVDNPSDKAFIVFEKKQMAKQIYDHFEMKHGHCYTISTLFHRFCGRENDQFESWQWYVQYAPFPDDIQWDDISRSMTFIWTMTLVFNLLIFIVFIFISTPSSALNIINKLIGVKHEAKHDSEDNKDSEEQEISDPITGLFWNYFPTLVLMSMAGILPGLIKGLNIMIPFKTKSEYNHSVMYKVFVFLLFMVFLLPSLVMNTGWALLDSILKTNTSEEAAHLNLACVFPAENSAFFMNYVITSTFIGNFMEVTRVAEMGVYLFCYLIISRNSAEYHKARQWTRFEFYFGIHYPKILLLLTLILTFSISSPLFAPIGLLYMISKHVVDRYLIYHVYIITKINQRVHSKAVVFVYFALLFLMFQVYTHLASMQDQWPSYLLGFLFIIHLLYTIFELFYDIFRVCLF